MERLFVKPATPELKVRKPANGYLAADGEEVNAEGYWLRRLADGDVVEEIAGLRDHEHGLALDATKATSRNTTPAI